MLERHDGSKHNSIVEYNQIKDFLKHCTYNTFVIFDLDNTIVESTQELGSDQWFSTLYESACYKVPGDETSRLVVEHYNSVQHHTSLKAVENKIVFIIKALQDIRIPVIALSARGIEIEKPTIHQLNKLGIHFGKQWHGEYDFNFNNKPKSVVFKNGIIFCNGANKGKCLKAFFDAKKIYPKHVLMVDDKEKHLLAVEQIVREHKGRFHGIRYGFLDEKVARYNKSNANLQLEQMFFRFTDKEKFLAMSVNRILSENDSEGKEKKSLRR